MPADRETPYISGFGDITLADRPTVGGKGASLGELTRASIPVPPGFVVTTAAFERFIAVIDTGRTIRDDISSLDPTDLSRVSIVTDQVRDHIESAPSPGDVLKAIAGAYRELVDDDAQAPVAVRSSATSEDSQGASFAGLQETLLWVRGEEAVLHSVRTCWASLYSSASVCYRLRLKLPEQNVAMGVVIQCMVDSRCSGVMFTRSPTTGDRSVIAIEGSWGLGSCIVSGKVTPDKFVVSKVTGEICKRTISQKLFQHVPRPDGSGVLTQHVPADRQATPCLTDDEVHALVEIGKHVERHYGAPQDIEWAIGREFASGEGIFVLQSRPETVWASREAQPVAAPRAKPPVTTPRQI